MPALAAANTPAMDEALAWLREHRVQHRQMNPHHIKVGRVSYWPGKGGIFVDLEPRRRPNTGLSALAAVLLELHLFLPPPSNH